MPGRKYLASTVLSLGLLAATAGADSVQLVSRVAPGMTSVTANEISAPHGAPFSDGFSYYFNYTIDAPPLPGSRLSADGRFAVFLSHAENLVAGFIDRNNQIDIYRRADIYLHDQVTGSTVLVTRSAASPVVTCNGWSGSPSISADGRFVVFVSNATDLVEGQIDTNGGSDIFVFDRVTGANSLVSRAAGTSATAGREESSSQPVISADGSWIAFSSGADDLVEGQWLNDSPQVFLFERSTGTATLVSHFVERVSRPGNGASVDASLSADGAFVVFISAATDLVAGVTDTNGGKDAFLYDRATGQSVLVSRTSASPTTAGNGVSSEVVLSADGSHVAFVSQAGDLVAGQSGPGPTLIPNVFLYRRSDAAVTLVSHAMAGSQQTGHGSSHHPAISQDGAFVAFVSAASDLAPPVSAPTTFDPYVFLYQRSDGAITRLSDARPPGVFGFATGHPRISADGGEVAFASLVNLDGALTFGGNVHLYSRASGIRTLVSRSMASPSTPANGVSSMPELSANGEVVAFASRASDLIGRDFNDRQDVFLYKRATGTLTAASVAAVPSQTPAWTSRSTSISEDGNVVTFYTEAPNLAPGQVDQNGTEDVFVWSRTEGTTRLVSRAAGSSATAADGASVEPVVSADGDWIVFPSKADNLVPGQSGANAEHIFLFERPTGQTILVSHVAGAPATPSPGGAERDTALSRDGRFVAFCGSFRSLIPGQSQGANNSAFLYDRVTDSTVLASHASGAPTTSANGQVFEIDLSADGRFLAFASTATDLLPDLVDSNGADDMFVYDRETGVVALASRSAGSPLVAANARSSNPQISADGRWILFWSLASNLVAGQIDTGNSIDVFLHDRVTGTTALVSHAAGQPAMAVGAESIDLSADGRFAVFSSQAGNVVADVVPQLGKSQAYLFDRTTGENRLVSRSITSGTACNGGASHPLISADGRFVTFVSGCLDLVAGMVDGGDSSGSVFLYERSTEAIELVSRRDDAPLVAEDVVLPRAISADGGQVLFDTLSPLVPEDGNSPAVFIADLYLYENVLPGADFYTVALCRALDTREPADGPALVSGVRQLFTVPGACGIPETARAAALTVTAVQATGQGYLKLHAGNASSQSSSINFAANQNRSNNAIVRLSTNGDGTIAITPYVAGGGTVHVILDVAGYFE